MQPVQPVLGPGHGLQQAQGGILQQPGLAGVTHMQVGTPGVAPAQQQFPAPIQQQQVQGLVNGSAAGYPQQQATLMGGQQQTARLPTPPPVGTPAQTQMGFTQEQLLVLRQQIVAFKTLKASPGVPLSPEIMAAIRVLPLAQQPSQQAQQGAQQVQPGAQPGAQPLPQPVQQQAMPMQQAQTSAAPVGVPASVGGAAAPGQMVRQPAMFNPAPTPNPPAPLGMTAPAPAPLMGAGTAARAPSPALATLPMQQPRPPGEVAVAQQAQQAPQLQQPGQQPPAAMQQQQQAAGQLSSQQLPPRPASALAASSAAADNGSLIRTSQGTALYSISGVAAKGGAGVVPKAPPGQAGSHPMLFDVAGLIASEYRKMLDRRRAERVAELAAAEKVAIDPGFAYRSAKMPVGRVKLEQMKLRLVAKQAQLRAHIEQEQLELLNMQERRYQNIRRGHRSNKIEIARKDIAARAERAGEQARSAKNHRQELAEKSAALRDLRVGRNRGVARAHERLAREHNKQKGDDRAMRLEALKAHDFEAYQELLRQQSVAAGGAGEKYEAISKFLHDTEEYLHKLAAKIANVKLSAEASQAAARAISEARAKGLSEEEAQAAANAAAESAAADSSALVKQAVGSVADAQSRYYQLAHSAQEEIKDQPTLLRPPNGAKLREYQMVGLQWMVSLYNNHLNGILADEMGLGKTVQVMSLIAYLMEKKSNFGPHLIIVPNAVLVNWKAELTLWLPSVRCVYYTGNKEERTRKYAQEVQSLQFNVLVTTYEFIMRDRTKLSKVDWQYIIIDEAQRMKDRQSKLARDLDRFNAQRRLLLSGTPLQNDLQELWSLLNLLLPDVFDDKKGFAEWFGDAIASTQGGGDGGMDWLEMEKRVVVIHRLHQILEPFMLRRQVEDVESKLPPKVAMVVKVPMTPYQSAIYDWVKATGTIRLDPSVPMPGRNKRPYASLNNKCMELRKVCNHPMLSYPAQNYAVGEAIVRTCGKLVTLDRMLIKLRAAGHRVLLFSTMTRLLDLMEVYLQWRAVPPTNERMKYLRIDGSTSLEARESAIQRFNAPDSDVFLFLLSIRAAGRGLNLQSSDTVVIYDPDPNPKNEEQAIARSHRIGQNKEVRVIHLEAVADAHTPPPPPPPPGAPPPPKLYADSIESLVRNQIQKIKIDMASEIIDAGRFDMQTSMEERRHTLETLLQDEDRLKKAQNVVPSNEELNRQLARGPEEFALFQKMDAELQWLDPNDPKDIPHWLRWSRADLLEATSGTKHKPDKAAELAALTGTVLHNHRPPKQQRQQRGAPPPRGAPAPPGRPHVPAAQVRAALAGAWQAAAAAPATAAAAEPEVTVTTTSLGFEGVGEEDEEVMMAEMAGNDEEEEVLDANIAVDDVTEAPSLSQPGGGSMRRIQSTAATLRAPSTGGGSDADGASPGEGGGEPLAKRRKGLSVHFVDGSGGSGDGQGGEHSGEGHY